jgi:hypothetical protein
MRLIFGKLGFPVLLVVLGPWLLTLNQLQAAQPSSAVAPGSNPTAVQSTLDPATPSPAELEGSHIIFATPIADFGRAQSGEIVKYDYIFTNTNPNSAIEIKAVESQCGCTTSGDWTRRVEPGQTGTIPIQFNTATYQGAVVKSVSVITSENTNAPMQLLLKGTIWSPVEVNPIYAIINASEGATNGSVSVRVTITLDQPVYFGPPKSLNPLFVPEISTNQPGKDYSLTVQVVGTLKPGSTTTQITLTPTSTNLLPVNVLALLNVRPVAVPGATQR